jgi:hypothetical protein
MLNKFRCRELGTIMPGRNRVTVSNRTVVQNYSSVGPPVGMLFITDGAPMKTCLSPAGKWHALRNMVVTAALVMLAGYVTAQDKVALNPDHPDTYVVQTDDTLWDISNMFLKDPWFWPEIWYVNPQVENPHLIFPGDVLNLVYVEGQPRVEVTRGPATTKRSEGTDRLSPQIRSSDLDNAITSIPFTDIQPFLAGGMIMDKDEIQSLPYIVAIRDHLVAGAGHEVYVENMPEDAAVDTDYFVLRLEEELKDPETKKTLGWEVLFIGNAELRANGDPATLFLTDTDREARRGDRIRKADLTLPMNYFPSAPAQQTDGQIISVVDGATTFGQYQMVMLNRGTKHGLTEGNVLAVWQNGKVVNDDSYKSGSRAGYGSQSSKSMSGKKVTLPDTFAGNVMIIKAYEDISYALVMEAVSEMRVLDRVVNP